MKIPNKKPWCCCWMIVLCFLAFPNYWFWSVPSVEAAEVVVGGSPTEVQVTHQQDQVDQSSLSSHSSVDSTAAAAAASADQEFEVGVKDVHWLPQDGAASSHTSTPAFELGGEILQRIQQKLHSLGVLANQDAKIQLVAREELERWKHEQAMMRKQREEILQQREESVLTTPAEVFPYDLQAPPEPINGEYFLEFVKGWKPPGGGRYEEYTLGTSPYIITDELRQLSDDIARQRRPYIREAMKFAWKGYVDYAFGMDEVRPQSKKGSNHFGGIGVTLVDSLDTLWLMDMREEFWHARNYVRDKLSHNQNRKVSVFETTIRSLGGLLSAYDLSQDSAFLEEALDLARRLMRAFDNNGAGNATLLPFGEVNLSNGRSNMIPWAGGNAILSEFGTLQLEFRFLDQIIGSEETKRYRDRVEKIVEFLSEVSPANGLFPYYMRPASSQTTTSSKNKSKNNEQAPPRPQFSSDHLTFGALADSFYEYMLKAWLQGGKTEPMYREMYDKAMQGMHDELLHFSTPSGLTYLADKIGNKRIHHKMDHLVCFVGGMLALGAYTDPLGLDSNRAQRDLQTAKALTYTCYQMYARMNTGISPEYVEFHPGNDLQVGSIAPHYLLRPEAVESFYVLNVLTGDPIYREWGWEVFQSIEKYCKGNVAYGSLGNVQDPTAAPRDEMESFFLAETLKYLYLLNDPDSEIDILNKHVFNTEAHPLRMFPSMNDQTVIDSIAS